METVVSWPRFSVPYTYVACPGFNVCVVEMILKNGVEKCEGKVAVNCIILVRQFG